VVLAVICRVCLDCVMPIVIVQNVSTLFSVRGSQTASAVANYWTSAAISQLSSVYLWGRHSHSLPSYNESLLSRFFYAVIKLIIQSLLW